MHLILFWTLFCLGQWVVSIGWLISWLYPFSGLFPMQYVSRTPHPPPALPLPPTSQRLLVFCCGYLNANRFNLCSDPGTWLLCLLMTVFILLTDIFKWTAACLLSHSTIIWFCRSCLTGKSLFQAKLWENSINHRLFGREGEGEGSKTTVKKVLLKIN